ncbi:hypothetical protein C2845_PM04G23880 [Panicum miliaceum]|uniref:F-box domain-containing protein n=1 Tax=Panicum miliaceum TaxID=4540 RepID=A0A3L6QVG7_PANMI|nr:hypothetical protein C2845_PM04G23880 [Panicum miliaceum]
MANQLSEKDLSIAPRQGRMLIMSVNATKFPLTKRPPKRQVFESGTAHPGFVLDKNSCRKSREQKKQAFNGGDWTGLIPTKRLPSPGGGLLLLGRAYQQRIRLAGGHRSQWKGRLRLRAEEGEGQSVDRISDLPDTILGDIVSRLPAKDGARTQVLSSRWRRTWRSAPLNLDLRSQPVPLGKVHRILSSHPGPGRCFSTPARYYNELHSHSHSRSAAILDGWLRSRALNNLQELDFRLDIPFRDRRNPPPLPASALRFSCTLRIARFWFCRFPDGISIRLPVLEELQLSHAIISESSLHALLAGCPALQRLLLTYNAGCSRVRIASPTLRSIDVGRGVGDLSLQQHIIEDAPCLERFHHHKAMSHHKMDICVMSAPKLGILGHIYDHYPRLEIGPTVFQGLRVVTMATVLHSVKVLSLTNNSLSLNAVLNFMKCFPCLEKLNIQTLSKGSENVWGALRWSGRLGGLVRLLLAASESAVDDQSAAAVRFWSLALPEEAAGGDLSSLAKASSEKKPIASRNFTKDPSKGKNSPTNLPNQQQYNGALAYLFGGSPDMLRGHRVKLSLGETLQMKNLHMSFSGAVRYTRVELPSSMPNLETATIHSRSEIADTPMLHSKYVYLKNLRIALIAETFPPTYDYFSLASFFDACPSLETFLLDVSQRRMEHVSILEDPSDLRQMQEQNHHKLKSVEILGFTSSESLIELACHAAENVTSLERLTLEAHQSPLRCYLPDHNCSKCSTLPIDVLMEAQRALFAIRAQSSLRSEVGHCGALPPMPCFRTHFFRVID